MIPYYGGKTWLKKHIKSITENVVDVNGFIDVFVGGGSITDSLVDVYEHGIINDIDINLINLYETIKNSSSEFIEFTKMHKNELGLDEIKKFKYQVGQLDEFNQVERAFKYYVMARTSYSGKTYACPTNWKLDKFKKMNVEQDIVKIKSTLDKVDILNKNYSELNFSNTLCYCDPPYCVVYEPYYGLHGKNHKNFNHDEFHEWICNISKNNKVIISYDNSESIKNLYCDWNITEVNKKTTHINKGENISSSIKELIITNF